MIQSSERTISNVVSQVDSAVNQLHERAAELAARSDRPADGKAVALTPLERRIEELERAERQRAAFGYERPFAVVAVGGTNKDVLTVQKNGSDTTITCTMAEAMLRLL